MIGGLYKLEICDQRYREHIGESRFEISMRDTRAIIQNKFRLRNVPRSKISSPMDVPPAIDIIKGNVIHSYSGIKKCEKRSAVRGIFNRGSHLTRYPGPQKLTSNFANMKKKVKRKNRHRNTTKLINAEFFPI